MTIDERCHGESPLITVDENESPASMTVIEATAAVSNTSIEELPPLYDVADPDALDHLFTQSTTGRVTFRYDGYGVCVDADGSVSISERPDTATNQ